MGIFPPYGKNNNLIVRIDMKFNKMILSGLLLGASLCANAQEQKTETVDVFNPHWYIQAQVGAQHTLGEVSFGDLISPNAQLSVGRNFNPVLGLRLGVNAWQSKGGWETGTQYEWEWNYVAPSVDLTMNLSNLTCGYKADRKFNVSWFIGLGANIAFNNDEAADVNAAINGNPNGQNLSLLWDGTKVRLQGRTGLMADYNISDRWSVGLEVQANLINDHYNSKAAGNSDWYFNGLLGVKYNFSKTHTKKEVAVPAAPERIIERVVERVVEKPAPAVAPAAVAEKVVEPLRRDVFFTIRSTSITSSEMQKVKDIADYLKANPKATVEITGYADKGTGNAAINKGLSEKRAKVVVDTLVKEYGIDASRIKSDSKGDTVQPFEEEILNRVSICIAK